MTEAPRRVRVLLVGMMGSGKTTVGRALSRLSGWPYVDNDALVAELAGVATPVLQSHQGGDALHLLEAVVCDRILEMDPPLVAGIPGSAIVTEPMRERLRASGHVVWLRARIDTLAARVGDGGTRPFLAGNDVRDSLTRLYEGREPLYAACAHQVVDVDSVTPEAVAAAILAELVTD
jgi:shikimate kinase